MNRWKKEWMNKWKDEFMREVEGFYILYKLLQLKNDLFSTRFIIYWCKKLGKIRINLFHIINTSKFLYFMIISVNAS